MTKNFCYQKFFFHISFLQKKKTFYLQQTCLPKNLFHKFSFLPKKIVFHQKNKSPNIFLPKFWNKFSIKKYYHPKIFLPKKNISIFFFALIHKFFTKKISLKKLFPQKLFCSQKNISKKKFHMMLDSFI